MRSAGLKGCRRLRVWMPILTMDTVVAATISGPGARVQAARIRFLGAVHLAMSASLIAIRRGRPCCLLFAAVLAAIIVSDLAQGGDARPADAVAVFQCSFGDDWDVNFDHWPDRWARKTGIEYPHYVKIAIDDDASAAGRKCLRLDLDGAAAEIASPPIRVMSRFSYIFEVQLKTERLEHSAAVAMLEFSDAAGHVLQTEQSKPISDTKGWQTVRFDPVELKDKSIDRVVFRLQVVRGTKGDLQGRISLTDVWLARLPRIVVSSDTPYSVYTDPNAVVVRCELSGIRERDPEIYFQLIDENNNELQSEHFPLQGNLIVDDGQQKTEITDGVGQGPAGYEGKAEWRPKVPDYGLYRVVVKMLSSELEDGDAGVERTLDNRTVWLAVVPPLPMPREGEFGWTLPRGDRPLSFQDLSQLLPQVGINWVKVPVWFDANDPRRGDELIRFVELMGASNIETVGLIDRPPATSELAARLDANTSIADLLSLDPTVWSPALEPVMTRLSLRVRWWQLGRDFDTSFAGLPGVVKRIDDVRTLLFRFGQDVRLGLSSDWDSETPHAGTVSWDFEQLALAERPAEEEFAKLLAMPRRNSAERWISVVPPPPLVGEAQFDQAARAARSSQFVRQLVAAKVAKADKIFVQNPFDEEHGLMQSSGMPDDLLLPWRTTAAMLGGGEYLGEMQLPNHSENRVFLRPDGRVVMVVWNSEPGLEELYLGEDVRHIDIAGRTKTLREENGEQVIEVGPQPSFVLGLHEAITRWRMQVSFEHNQVPSIFSKPHPNALRFKNFFAQGAGGSFRIVVPQQHSLGSGSRDRNPVELPGFAQDRWVLEPPQGAFALAPGQEMQFPFEVELRNALYGKQPLRIDFKLQADEQYTFSVYSELKVGTEELTLEVNSFVDKDGTLIVEQFMTNSGEHFADFRCYLSAKGHRRQRMQVYRLGPNLDRKVYRFPHGRNLVGDELLLEIEELNGPRVIKYRFIAADNPPKADEQEQEQEHKNKSPDRQAIPHEREQGADKVAAGT